MFLAFSLTVDVTLAARARWQMLSSCRLRTRLFNDFDFDFSRVLLASIHEVPRGEPRDERVTDDSCWIIPNSGGTDGPSETNSRRRTCKKFDADHDGTDPPGNIRGGFLRDFVIVIFSSPVRAVSISLY